MLRISLSYIENFLHFRALRGSDGGSMSPTSSMEACTPAIKWYVDNCVELKLTKVENKYTKPKTIRKEKCVFLMHVPVH